MHFLALLLAALLACAFASDNSSPQLNCHSIKNGSLKLTTHKHNHSSLIASVNISPNSSLLSKADKPLHAEIFKCNHHPDPKNNGGAPLAQLRVDGKCAILTHAGFGVENGIEFDECAKNLSSSKEQWIGPLQPKKDGPISIVPVSLEKDGYGLLSMGIVGSYFDALAFSFADTANKNATVLDLVLDPK